MSLTKRIGYGITLGCDPTGASSFTTLGAVVDGIDGPDAKTDKVDTTILSDKFKTAAGAQIDPGTVTFKIAYDPSDTDTTQKLTALHQSSDVASWQVTYPGPVTDNPFLGFVAGFKRTIETKTLVVAEVTIQVSGTPGYGTTAAA